MSQLLKGLGLVGAGAYGYQQVQTNEALGSVNRVLGMLVPDARSHSGAPASASGAGGEQMKVLQGEVDRLHQLLSDVVRGQRNSPTHTVIHTGGRSWSVYIYPVVGAGLVYVYCRVRGISMFDLLYVSQNSLSQFKTTVTEGFGKIWEEVRKQKDEMMAKLGMVGRKQEQLMESQAQMDERLRQVGDSVDDVKVNTHNINNRVMLLDGKMAEVRDGMANVQQGIMLLCHTVAEVTNRIGMNNTRSSQALKGFLSTGPGPATLTGGQQPSGGMGLNCLLESGPAGDGSGDAVAAAAAVVYEVAAPEPAPAKGSAGPPSFPASAGSKASTLTGALWGMGRKY